jgi:hypothetical protein
MRGQKIKLSGPSPLKRMEEEEEEEEKKTLGNRMPRGCH